MRLQVIDDFYSDPDAVRARALKGAYGRHSWRPKFCEWDEYFTGEDVEDELMLRIASLVGASISYDPKVQGFFRVLTAAAYEELLKKPIVVHIDNYDWAGLVVLNTDEQLEALGRDIAFPQVRHKTTGIAELCSNADWTAEFKRDSNDFSRWEVVAEVKFKYNRMILFNPRHFHILAPGFGTTLEDSKLIQQFQFYQDGSPGPHDGDSEET